jgi:hypothetical protein
MAIEVWAMTRSRKANEKQMRQAAQQKSMVFPTVNVVEEW